MALIFISFISGMLTILAPCVLPVLPVILWGTLNETNYKRICVIIISFIISIITFTFLLKVSTIFIDVSPQTWRYISWTILISFGIISIFPALREYIKLYTRIKTISWPKRSQHMWGQILLWASLGPIFTTCSPTYTLIIATILPLSLWQWAINILAYALWLGFVIGMIAFFGKILIKKLNIISDSNGRFKKILGVVIILTGISLITGFDKTLESIIIDYGRFGVTNLEKNLINTIQ